MCRIVIVAGTRPEAIKVAPVYRELKKHYDVRLLATGQHRELLNRALDGFGVVPDHMLDVMTETQNPAVVAGRVMIGSTPYLVETAPDLVIVQGDTVSALAVANAAYLNGIPVAHLEAGLRTGIARNPFPEEMARCQISVTADLHFAPTRRARANLIAEGRSPDTIAVTGNTGIDAFQSVRVPASPPMPKHPGQRRLLATLHRRESWGEGLAQVAQALVSLRDRHPDLEIVVVLHRSPQARASVLPILNGQARITLMPPQDYAPFVALMRSSDLIVTDSGGIQEEAPSCNAPVFVVRRTTERPEAALGGLARVVGTESRAIVDEVSAVLGDDTAYRAMTGRPNPFGDGRAAARIATALSRWRAGARPLLAPEQEFAG